MAVETIRKTPYEEMGKRDVLQENREGEIMIDQGDYIEVTEMFVSQQGEGPSVGVPAVFVRMRGCPLHCIWCDSLYSSDPDHPDYSKYELLTTGEVVYRVLNLAEKNTQLVVLTGGEPMIWQRQLAKVVRNLPECEFEVETAGIIIPRELRSQKEVMFNVSTKLKSARPGLNSRNSLALREFSKIAKKGRAIFKFVISPKTFDDDVTEVEEIQLNYDIDPRLIYLMPEGVIPGRVMDGMRRLAPMCLEKGWNLTTRLQILMWGNIRGR